MTALLEWNRYRPSLDGKRSKGNAGQGPAFAGTLTCPDRLSGARVFGAVRFDAFLADLLIDGYSVGRGLLVESDTFERNRFLVKTFSLR